MFMNRLRPTLFIEHVYKDYIYSNLRVYGDTSFYKNILKYDYYCKPCRIYFGIKNSFIYYECPNENVINLISDKRLIIEPMSFVLFKSNNLHVCFDNYENIFVYAHNNIRYIELLLPLTPDIQHFKPINVQCNICGRYPIQIKPHSFTTNNQLLINNIHNHTITHF
jgi:hypothetical protein